MATGSKIKNNLVIQGDVTASAFSGDGSGLTGINTDTSNLATTASNSFTGDQTITGNVVATGDSSRVRFLASALSDLPSATDNHGMFAHVHATGLGYYAHAGNWIPLATSESVATIDVTPPSTYFNSSLLTTENISKNFNYTSSLNVVEITSSVEGAIIDYRLTNLNSGSRVGTFYYAHDGTNLSYNDLTVPGAGIGSDPNLSATLTGSIVSLDIENAAGFNFSGFAKKFSKLNVPVTVYDPNVSYFLDIVDNDPAAAFSLRQLSQLYTGSAIRVREDSGNTEADIGFDLNGNLDEAAIISHCGSANGYVTTWYDQSGNGNNATNTNASKQWAIYNGSSVYTVNGKPAMYSNGTNKYFTHTLPAGTSWSTFDIFKGDNSSTIGMHTRSPYAPWMYLGDNTTQTSVFNGFSNAELYQNTQQMSISTRIQFRDDINNGGQQVLVFFGDYNAPSTTWYLGTSYGNNYGLKGWLQESIIYNTDESSKRSDYETSINNYYGIYDTGLLEDYSGVAAAYSVRQLTTAFTSSMNIRRASDNTEQVIGFTANGDLDTGSIETFCAGTECYVDTWYDQSGNGNNAEQTNASTQPLIYTSSAVVIDNGKPALLFEHTADNVKDTLDYTDLTSQEFSFIWVYNKSSSTRLNWGNTNGNYLRMESSGLYIVKSGDFDFASGLLGSPGQRVNAIIRYSDTEALGYQNGSNVSNWATLTTSSFSRGKIDATYVSRPNSFKISEHLYWTESVSSSIADIDSNINSYFNIY
jgi:hypothetical protein